MPYKYITGCYQLTLSMSYSLWYHEETGDYYISPDYKEQIIEPNQIDYSYTLLYNNNKQTKYSEYREQLSADAKKLSMSDIYGKSVQYKGSHWNFKL